MWGLPGVPAVGPPTLLPAPNSLGCRSEAALRAGWSLAVRLVGTPDLCAVHAPRARLLPPQAAPLARHLHPRHAPGALRVELRRERLKMGRDGLEAQVLRAVGVVRFLRDGAALRPDLHEHPRRCRGGGYERGGRVPQRARVHGRGGWWRWPQAAVQHGRRVGGQGGAHRGRRGAGRDGVPQGRQPRQQEQQPGHREKGLAVGEGQGPRPAGQRRLGHAQLARQYRGGTGREKERRLKRQAPDFLTGEEWPRLRRLCRADT